METENLREKIERWIILSEQLDSEKASVYIKDVNGNYFMGHIVLVGENKITVDCFAPEQRAGKREIIRWVEVVKCVEYVEEVRE